MKGHQYISSRAPPEAASSRSSSGRVPSSPGLWGLATASESEARAEDTDIFFLEGGGDGDLEPTRFLLSSLQKSQIF